MMRVMCPFNSAVPVVVHKTLSYILHKRCCRRHSSVLGHHVRHTIQFQEQVIVVAAKASQRRKDRTKTRHGKPLPAVGRRIAPLTLGTGTDGS